MFITLQPTQMASARSFSLDCGRESSRIREREKESLKLNHQFWPNTYFQLQFHYLLSLPVQLVEATYWYAPFRTAGSVLIFALLRFSFLV
jgi:hypothetical protein